MPRSRPPRVPDDPRLDKARLGLDNYEKGKSFEQKVADLFSLLGYQTLLDYKVDDMQFDLRLELSMGIPIYGLVECKNTERVTQEHVRDFASKVDSAVIADGLTYQAILVAGNGFANNAHVIARKRRVQLRTYEELLRSLVDLRPNLDAAVRSFQDTPLERLYVEQKVVLEGEIRPGEEVPRKGLTEAVLGWLERPASNLLTLLGDFGCGKTSFSKRLASQLALQAREEMAGSGPTRVPVLIDLREGGSSTVTLESLLTQHFQRLSSQPFNPQALLQLNREGYLVLLFDGFDETITYTEPSRYLESLRQILRAAEGKAKVVMTCRTHYFRDRPEVLDRLGKAPARASTPGATQLLQEIQEQPGAEIGYILEFSQEQISEYLRKALPPPADWQAFQQRIHDTYNLENLAERPFLLEMIVRTLPSLEHQGDVTLADLYERYCASWFKHSDFRLTLTRDHKEALVEHLARLVWASKEGRVHYTELYREATEYFKDRSLSFQDRERVDYEVRTALFLNRDAEGYYSFIHRSFLEFFIARTLRTGLAAGDASCLGLRRLTREVVFFLEFWPEAKKIPEFAGQVLARAYQPDVSENALLLLYLHARANLGPLLGPEAITEPDLLLVREEFSKIRPKAIHLEGADLEGIPLPGIDLSFASLDGSLLRRADLRQASLKAAQLKRVDLQFGDFRGGEAEGANFEEANLAHLDARDAIFRRSTLTAVDLSFSKLIRADFRDADIQAQTIGTALLGAKGLDRVFLNATAGRPSTEKLDLHRSVGHFSGITSVVWSPQGSCVATGSNDGTIKLWDITSGQLLNTIEGHSSWISSLSWSSDGAWLASASYDRTVKIWDAPTGLLLKTLKGHVKAVLTVAWSPDGTRLASGSYDHTVKIWEASSGELLESFENHTSYVNSVAWSPEGTQLASGSFLREVKIWEISSRRLLYSRACSVSSISWSPDGKRLAIGSSNSKASIWDSSSGHSLCTLEGHSYAISTVSWAPDSKRLASGSHDRTVKVWDVSSGELQATFSGHDRSVLTVSWSPDGMRLASGSYDHNVKIWDVSNGQLLFSIAEQEYYAGFISWSLDGTRFAFDYQSHTLIWDVSSGQLLNSIAADGSGMMRFESQSPDGSRLVTSFGDGPIKVWDLTTTPPCLLALFCPLPSGYGFASTPDGYVSGPPEALAAVRFRDNWALYDITDVPERVSPQRVAAALRGSGG